MQMVSQVYLSILNSISHWDRLLRSRRAVFINTVQCRSGALLLYIRSVLSFLMDIPVGSMNVNLLLSALAEELPFLIERPRIVHAIMRRIYNNVEAGKPILKAAIRTPPHRNLVSTFQHINFSAYQDSHFSTLKLNYAPIHSYS